MVDGAKAQHGRSLVEFSDPVGTLLQDGLQLRHNTLVGSPCAVQHRHRGAASADQAAATKRQDGAAESRHKALKTPGQHAQLSRGSVDGNRSGTADITVKRQDDGLTFVATAE